MDGTLIFFKIQAEFKMYQNFAAFTKTELQNNETFIFFKIWIVFQKFQDWSCIYRVKNEQWR